MSEAAEQLIIAGLQLSEAERLAVADALYESLPHPSGGLSADDPGFDAILRQRLADYEAGKTKAIPGDEFFQRLREKQR